MRIGGKLISGAEKIALLEEQVTTSGFISVCDDEVARGSDEIFEFGDSFGCVIGPTVEGSDTRAFAENGGTIDVPVCFAHPCERLFQKSGESIEASEFVAKIGREHRAAEGDLKLSVRFFLRGGLSGERGKSLAAVGGTAFPEKDESLRILGIELVERTVRELDSAVIFFSRVAEIAHESARAGEALLGRQLHGVHLERGCVVLQRGGSGNRHTRGFPRRMFAALVD